MDRILWERDSPGTLGNVTNAREMKRDGRSLFLFPFRNCCYGAIICGIVYPALGQQSTSRLSLDDSMRRALKQHPSLSRFQDLTGAAATRVTQARAGIMPSLEFQGAVTDGPTGAPALGLRGLAGDPLKKHYGSSVNLFYTLFDFGRTDHLVSSRRFQLGAAR